MLDFTADEKKQDLANRLTEVFRRQTKKKAAKALFMGVSPLALAACGGGSSNSIVSDTDDSHTVPSSELNEGSEIESIDGDLNDEIVATGGITQKMPFDTSNFDLSAFEWLTPASTGNFGESIKIENGDESFVVLPAMFDVEHGSSPGTPISGNLIVFRESSGTFIQLDDAEVTGFATHLFASDIDGDGVDEIIGVPNGEDGRVISNEVTDAYTQPFIYDVIDNELTYFGTAAWQHAYGFADVNYDGNPDLIVAPIGTDPEPVSKVYNLLDFTEIQIDHQFMGHGEGEIAMSDIDGDGLIEFVETDSSWTALSGDGNLYLNVYEIDQSGAVILQQSDKFGQLDGGRYQLQSWNSDESQGYPTGQAFGKEFNTLHRWHSEFVDLDADNDEDLVMIFSIDPNEVQSRGDTLAAGNNYVSPIHIVTIENKDGALDYTSLKVTQIDADFVGKGFTFTDLNGDGFTDMYLDINLMLPDFDGSDLGDRIWLNDGSGNFAPIGDAADDNQFGREFLSAGEYTVLDIGGEKTLIGVTSNLDGTDLSFISLPISEVIA